MLGIIAGGGAIPQQLVERCRHIGIKTKVVGLKGNTDIVKPDTMLRIGAGASINRYFKTHGVTDIVMIGGVKRPSLFPGLFELWPDWVTFKFFLKALIKSFGDNDMLTAARAELEKLGFTLHGVHKFLPELLMDEGVLTKAKPASTHYQDIQVGIKESQALGVADIGQAVIVKNGKIIAREDVKGTSALIKDYGIAGAILVKSCKPQQDMDLDLPTIGPNTIKLCAEKNMVGVVGQTAATLLVEKDIIKTIADENGLFVLGVTIDGALK